MGATFTIQGLPIDTGPGTYGHSCETQQLRNCERGTHDATGQSLIRNRVRGTHSQHCINAERGTHVEPMHNLTNVQVCNNAKRGTHALLQLRRQEGTGAYGWDAQSHRSIVDELHARWL
jgi:hypothetical protein